MTAFSRLLVVTAAFFLAACDRGPKGSAGFTLPDGDAERGKVTYMELQCHACHSIAGMPQLPADGSAVISVPLGGETAHIKTYGELVTSIINPSHRISRSRISGLTDEEGHSLMINYNEIMSVSQLINLVAFVQSSYELMPFEYSSYPVYPIPLRNPAAVEVE